MTYDLQIKTAVHYSQYTDLKNCVILNVNTPELLIVLVLL